MVAAFWFFPGALLIFSAVLGRLTGVLVEGGRRMADGNGNYERVQNATVIVGYHRDKTPLMVENLIAGQDGDDKSAANNRYLMVTAEFVEALLDKPEGARLEQAELDKRRQARTTVEAIVKAIDGYKAANGGALPADLAALTMKPAEGEALLQEVKPDPWGNAFQFTQEGAAFFVTSLGVDGKPGGDGAAKDVSSAALADEDAIDEAASAWTAYDGQVKTGQEEADQLTQRFGPWYYVIDKALFDKLKPQRVDLVKAKEADAAAAGPDGGK